MTDVLLALLLGFGAGVLSGMFGVGGGILFVPTLAIVLGMTQLGAQATSLAAMIPVVVLGAWRQHRYGNVRWRPALVVGLASAFGVAGGAALASSLSDDVLRRLFAALLVVTAIHLVRTERRRTPV
jgi:uncharacterized membrane protein YfcA